MDTLTIFVICFVIVGVNIFRFKIGFPSSYSLLPFQAGLLYRRGRPVRVVEAGRHRIWRGRERIIFLDKRPIQVSVEGRAVTLADGATVVFGIAASAEVRDVKKALYASAAYSQIPSFVALCVTRGMLNRCEPNRIVAGQTALTEEIIAQCRSRLAVVGFQLLSFQFTQLQIAAPAPIEN